jgi:DNA-binding NarL/FixJ family response regulator
MRLTSAERRALEAYGRCGTIKAAAHSLGKSPRTIEHQLKSARDRLGVGSNVQAVVRVMTPDIG